MKIPQIVYPALLSLLAGAAGYLLNFERQDASAATRYYSVPLDYLLSPRSFSEIENTKGVLEALSIQVLNEVRSQRISAISDRHNRNVRLNPKSLYISRTIEQLQYGMDQFSGTEQEFVFLKELLAVLAKGKQNERWIEVYLAALYRHPTHNVIGYFASDAVEIAQRTKRGQDLENAFRHITNIPFDFEAKRPVGVALGQLQLLTAQDGQPKNHS